MRKEKKTDLIAEGILFLLFALFFLYLGKDSKFPIVYPDEAGYIGWARILSGNIGDGLHYYPGYSILAAPFFFFSDDITLVYPLMIRLNACLGALIPVFLYCLSKEWCKPSAVLKRFFLSAAASLYPAVTSYIRLAWCETLLLVLLLGMALCIVSLEKNRKSPGMWVLLGFLGIWASLTHPRGVMFCLGALVTAAVLFRDKKKLLAGCGMICVCIIGAGVFFVLSDSSHVGASHVTDQLLHLLTAKGMFAFLTTLLSHFSYLLFSTYGMAAVGIYYGISSLKKREGGAVLWIFTLASFFFLWCLSALYMYHHERPDHILYGRYSEVIVPLLLLGVFSRWSKKKVPVWIWILSLLAVTVTGILYGTETANLDSWIIHCTGLFFSRLILHSFRYWWAAGLFAGFAILFLLIGKKQKNCTILCMFAMFLFQSIWMQGVYFEPEAKYKGRALSLAQQLPQNAQIYICGDRLSWEHHNYRVQRPDLVMSTVDSGQPYLMSNQLIDEGVLVGMECNRPLYLYRRDGEGEGLPYPDELTDYDAEYRWKQEENTLEVTVQNVGTPWLCWSSVKDLRHAVRLSVRQFDKEKHLISDQRFDFSENLGRDDSQTFSVLCSDVCEYVEIQPLIEFITWFSDKGDAPLVLKKEAGVFVETQSWEYDRNFKRIAFSHLKSANTVEGSTYAGNLVGFYGNDTGAEARIEHIKMPGGTGVLLIETNDRREHVSVILNDNVPIFAKKYEDGAYHFPFEGVEEITSITVCTDTVNPFEESGLPQWMSFLSLDSNLKPVQFAVHRFEDILGKSVNNHEFGLAIDAIEVRLEEVQ